MQASQIRVALQTSLASWLACMASGLIGLSVMGGDRTLVTMLFVVKCVIG